MQEVCRRLVFWKRVGQLLCGRGRSRVLGDGHVHEPPDGEYEEQSERDGWHHDQVGDQDLGRVICEEGPPSLRTAAADGVACISPRSTGSRQSPTSAAPVNPWRTPTARR